MPEPIAFPPRTRRSSRLAGIETSIFAEMTALAARHQAINLGQGFPDFDGPEFVKELAVAAIGAGHNQYCRTAGLKELARAIADHQRRHYGLLYDAAAEITVCAGATEALCVAFLALLDPGDEVVVFEPFYDAYPAGIAMAGAGMKLVSLRPPSFAFDPAELDAAISPRTRAIVVNSPNNPAGKVFSREELLEIARVCREHDLLAICDEVYEHIVFDAEHVPLATLPGMRERTLVISSSGKTFSLTGWKIGWACAPPPLSEALRAAHQFVTFCSGTPFQHALAGALGAEASFFAELRREYRRRRDRLCAGLREIGFGVLEPQGTYFAQADIRPLGFDDGGAFCRMLPERVGVAAIPTSAFYATKALARPLVRFAFCKTDATLDAALDRLRRLR